MVSIQKSLYIHYGDTLSETLSQDFGINGRRRDVVLGRYFSTLKYANPDPYTHLTNFILYQRNGQSKLQSALGYNGVLSLEEQLFESTVLPHARYYDFDFLRRVLLSVQKRLRVDKSAVSDEPVLASSVALEKESKRAPRKDKIDKTVEEFKVKMEDLINRIIENKFQDEKVQGVEKILHCDEVLPPSPVVEETPTAPPNKPSGNVTHTGINNNGQWIESPDSIELLKNAPPPPVKCVKSNKDKEKESSPASIARTKRKASKSVGNTPKQPSVPKRMIGNPATYYQQCLFADFGGFSDAPEFDKIPIEKNFEDNASCDEGNFGRSVAKSALMNIVPSAKSKNKSPSTKKK
jgi:hypothetical protein